jgi:HECT-domain (ubiquitin-transferase)
VEETAPTGTQTATVPYDLLPGGGTLRVINKNVAQFVSRYAHRRLLGSVRQQMDAVRRGFNEICGGGGGMSRATTAMGLLRCAARTCAHSCTHSAWYGTSLHIQDSVCIPLVTTHTHIDKYTQLCICTLLVSTHICTRTRTHARTHTHTTVYAHHPGRPPAPAVSAGLLSCRNCCAAAVCLT